MGQEKEDCGLLYGGYFFDFSTAVEAIEASGRGACMRVVLEAPQGMVQYLPVLAGFLEECAGRRGLCVEPLLRLDPSYGSCDIGFDYASRVGAGLVVHVGHFAYLYRYTCPRGGYCSQWEYGVRQGVGVVMVPGEYVEGHRWAERLADRVEGLGAGRVSVGYTAQHSSLARLLARLLQGRGVVVERLAPVMGCHYQSLARSGDSGVYVVLAGGLFHGLGLALYLYGTRGHGDWRVYVGDPYAGELRDIRGVAEKTIRARYGVLYRAMGAKRIGLLAGAKPGQYRPWLLEALRKMARRRGVEVDVLVSSNLSREWLDNLRPDSYDAYVAASCPRLAIEDFAGYWKPVLTPGEARMLLTGSLDTYWFPW